jgi:hypothetical protein
VKVRFLADADFNKAIVSGVLRREPSLDFLTAQAAGFRSAGSHSSGVFLVSQSLDVGRAIDELLLIWLASKASEWENRLEWLPL